jgi:hypothetical protein
MGAVRALKPELARRTAGTGVDTAGWPSAYGWATAARLDGTQAAASVDGRHPRNVVAIVVTASLPLSPSPSGRRAI